MGRAMKAKRVATSARTVPGKLARALVKRPAASLKEAKPAEKAKVLDEKTLVKQRTIELNVLKLVDLEQLHLSKGVGTEPVVVAVARTKEELTSKQLPELKDLCEEKNLKVGGTKGELIERLLDHAREELKVEMVKSLVAFEAKARADAREHEAKARVAMAKMRKDIASKTNQELKDMCVSKGLKPGASKEDRVARILALAKEKGEVDRALAVMACDERREQLLRMDEKALMELCNKQGVNPLVKAIMVDRLLLAESAGVGAARAMVA